MPCETSTSQKSKPAFEESKTSMNQLQSSQPSHFTSHHRTIMTAASSWTPHPNGFAGGISNCDSHFQTLIYLPHPLPFHCQSRRTILPNRHLAATGKAGMEAAVEQQPRPKPFPNIGDLGLPSLRVDGTNHTFRRNVFCSRRESVLGRTFWSTIASFAVVWRLLVLASTALVISMSRILQSEELARSMQFI